VKWFIPSWNGDLRLEPAPEEKTKLTVIEPTAAERDMLVRMGDAFENEGWVEKWRKRWGKKTEVVLNAPLEKVGPLASTIMRPGDAVLTAVNFQGGQVVTTTGSQEELEKLATEAKEKDAKAAATVKRPTPCCPACIPGAVEPATEALLAFLTDEQHDQWARRRRIEVQGGLSEHRYLLAHRYSTLAQKFGRICIDLDDGVVLHFHDWTVPPEEEVLAAMLILQHHEPWLRNEATLYDRMHEADLVFKNPFGDMTDGAFDAGFSLGFGGVLMHSLKNGGKMP
jgi:hypothetical protein